MTDKIYVVTASANKGQDWIICKALYGGILGSDIKKTAQAMLEEEYQDIKMHGKKIPRKHFKLVEYSDNAELLKQFEQLQAENAALRERLEKAVELPAKIGDTVYKVYDKCDGHNCPYNGYYGQWRCHYEGERRCKPFIIIKQFCYSDIPFVNKTIFVLREAAEARLKELQGGEE